jgi:hypothetical protein
MDQYFQQLQAADEMLRQVRALLGRHGRDHARALDEAANKYDSLRKEQPSFKVKPFEQVLAEASTPLDDATFEALTGQLPERVVTMADEIREATSRNVLHPLVAHNRASPRGLCNCSIEVGEVDCFVVWCTRDYGHEGPHLNGHHQWEAPWQITGSKFFYPNGRP